MADQSERPAGGAAPPDRTDDDPYADEDLSDYPPWWRRSIEHYRQYGLRPYRPPRFADGEPVPPVVFELEEALSVDVRFRARSPSVGEDWELWIDDEPIETVGRRRDGDGYTVYAIDADRFRELVREAAGDGTA